MDLVKAYCPYCHKEHSKDDPIFINPEEKTAICPNCLNEFKTKQGIKLFDTYISLLLHDAYYTLEKINDYEMAYRKFADILEIDESCCAAREGRIIALIYLSTMEFPQIQNAQIMFEKDLVQYLKNRPAKLVPFIRRVNETLNVYDSMLLHKLSNQGLFYTIDGLRFYMSQIVDIIKFKISILQYLERISTRAKDNSGVVELVGQVTNECNKLNGFLSMSEHYSPSGDTYNVISINHETGEALITRAVSAFDTSKDVGRYGTNSYFTKQKKPKNKNEIFHSRSSLYSFMNSLVSLGWLSLVLAFLSFVNTFLVIFFTDISYLPYIFGPLTIVLFILGLIMLLVHRNKFHQYYKEDK
ncbi:MAG: hypothetical protein LUC16_02360 [Coprobacillus sp.]|nr:hypothetical protein [Coprobacillus sp.]